MADTYRPPALPPYLRITREYECDDAATAEALAELVLFQRRRAAAAVEESETSGEEQQAS
jgi:hypothetical protein